MEHDRDEDDSLSIALEDTSATVMWLGHHEHVVPADSADARPWTTVVADVVAAALRGEYEVEVHYRGDHVVKTRLLDVRVVGRERDLGSTGLLFGWLRRGPIRVERKRLDYGVPIDRA